MNILNKWFVILQKNDLLGKLISSMSHPNYYLLDSTWWLERYKNTQDELDPNPFIFFYRLIAIIDVKLIFVKHDLSKTQSCVIDLKVPDLEAPFLTCFLEI